MSTALVLSNSTQGEKRYTKNEFIEMTKNNLAKDGTVLKFENHAIKNSARHQSTIYENTQYIQFSQTAYKGERKTAVQKTNVTTISLFCDILDHLDD